MCRMVVRPKKTSSAGCSPVGPLGAPIFGEWECRCGERLRLARMSPGVNDWRHVDRQGMSHRDETPDGLKTDPVGWWQRLADTDLNAYSVLKASMGLGGTPFIHYHAPARPVGVHERKPPPYCCGSPMWASPDGWQCRVNGTLFPYPGGPIENGWQK